MCEHPETIYDVLLSVNDCERNRSRGRWWNEIVKDHQDSTCQSFLSSKVRNNRLFVWYTHSPSPASDWAPDMKGRLHQFPVQLSTLWQQPLFPERWNYEHVWTNDENKGGHVRNEQLQSHWSILCRLQIFYCRVQKTKTLFRWANSSEPSLLPSAEHFWMNPDWCRN